MSGPLFLNLVDVIQSFNINKKRDERLKDFVSCRPDEKIISVTWEKIINDILKCSQKVLSEK